MVFLTAMIAAYSNRELSASLLRFEIRAHFEQTSGDTSGCRERANQTGLQGVADINFTKEQSRISAQILADLPLRFSSTGI
jgi:hypothetical protein